MVRNIKCDKVIDAQQQSVIFFLNIPSDPNSLLLPIQALHDRAAPPSGQFCGEAPRTHAQTCSLQTVGFSQDPPDYSETEQIHSPQTSRAGLFIHISMFVQKKNYFLQPPSAPLTTLFFWGFQIHRASATIIEPTGESDNPLRFTSGLVLALDIDATLEHIQDPQATVKVQVRVLSSLSHHFHCGGR